MALNKEKYHLIGTPRVYCDVPSYLKAIGKKSIRQSTWGAGDTRWTHDIGNINWDMNPTRQRTDAIEYIGQSSSGEDLRYYVTEKIAFMEELGVENGSEGDEWIGTPISKDLRKLINNANYYGVLGHNINTLSGGSVSAPGIRAGQFPNLWDDVSGYNNPYPTELLSVADGDGTYLATVDSPFSNDGDEYAHGYRFNFYVEGDDPTGKIFELGAMTVGYYYDFPHSPNMKVNISYSFDGIKRKRTVGGSDLSQINYLKPSWGRFEPFSNTLASDSQDFTDVSSRGRRIIDMSFNYIDKTDMFPKNMHQNTFVQDTYTEGAYQGFDYDTGEHNANILGNFLNLTLGGNLTHILQLDSEAHDFIMVKLDGKATKITQVANGVYDVKFRWVEVW